jgi:hypothetical protein
MNEDARERVDTLKTAELKAARSWTLKKALRAMWDYHCSAGASKYWKR